MQSQPSFTRKHPDGLILPSLHVANRELRRAKGQVQKWERVCAALRELNKHRDIVRQIVDSSGRIVSEKRLPEALMAKVFTPEEREEVKARIVEFVRLSGRETFRQLADKTGVSKTAIRRLSGALAASGDVWLSGCGVFPSEQAYRVWRKTPEKAADPTLIRKLPDGEIRRYNRRQNIICRESRRSEVMQRVLAFYRGNFQEVME